MKKEMVKTIAICVLSVATLGVALGSNGERKKVLNEKSMIETSSFIFISYIVLC